jgi:hypothetical protein
MRKTLLASAALFGVVVIAPALTQTTVTPPTAPGSSGTAGPASPNGEPVTGTPTESEAVPGGATTGGTANTQATAPGPATSTAPAPGGTTQEQTTSQPANNKPVEPAPAASEGGPHQQATRPSRPEEMHAGTIKGPHRRPLAAPHSTTSSVDENASADQYLRVAQAAVRGRRIGEAQEALERAETRVLNSAPDTNAGQNSTVNTIEHAREALGYVRYLRPDLARGGQMIDQAMSETASKSTSSLSGGQSGSTNGANESVGPRM